MARNLIKKVLFWVYLLRGHIGSNVSIDIPQKATVIISNYSVERVQLWQPIRKKIFSHNVMRYCKH
jgi:molybdopterin-binding protein